MPQPNFTMSKLLKSFVRFPKSLLELPSLTIFRLRENDFLMSEKAMMSFIWALAVFLFTFYARNELLRSG